MLCSAPLHSSLTAIHTAPSLLVIRKLCADLAEITVPGRSIQDRSNFCSSSRSIHSGPVLGTLQHTASDCTNAASLLAKQSSLSLSAAVLRTHLTRATQLYCKGSLHHRLQSGGDGIVQLPSSYRSMASLQPENVVYSGPSSPSPKRVTLNVLRKKYHNKEPISVVTAYDYPSAVHVDEAMLDVLLVGDSVGMVVHGHDTTLPVTLDDMLVHCRAVARGARRAFLVGDLPFGSYETSTQDAIKSAVRMLKEGGMDAVKLEGGSPARVEAARAIVETGVAVMGHVGLTPQSISALGGFRPQAQAAEDAQRVLTQALALQAAGCFALVLECVPAPIAAAITAALHIPTIGIGAGPHCSGQVLVYHDLLGMLSHPHHAKVTPKFCKQYAQVGTIIQAALQNYREDVTSKEFPGPKFSPYKIAPEEVKNLAEKLRKEGHEAAAAALESHK